MANYSDYRSASGSRSASVSGSRSGSGSGSASLAAPSSGGSVAAPLVRPLLQPQFEEYMIADGYDYNINDVLGRGGFGAVMGATRREEIAPGQPPVLRQICVKYIDVENCRHDSEYMQNVVYRERNVLRHLSHPNIVRIFHIYIEKDANKERDCKVLIYMDRYEISLRDLITRWAMPKEPAVKVWIAHCIDALEYARKLHFCHRDIKVDNMMLDSKNNVCKLADFGMARIVHMQRGADGRPQVRLVRSGGGTTFANAPEKYEGNRYEPFIADMWSLGVAFFELLNGRMPFRADDPLRFRQQQLDRQKHPLPWKKVKSGLAHRASSEARALVDRMLDPTPATRITYAQLRADPYFRSVPEVQWPPGQPPPPPGQTIFVQGSKAPPRPRVPDTSGSEQEGATYQETWF